MNTGSMTKAELVEEVSRVSDLTKKHSEVIVDTVFKSIIDALHRGEKIELRGFGSFRLRRREPRKGRNPKTGDKVDVPPHGINMGINIGKPAGAGILDHVHMHVVPRWNGDTNFMTVVGQTRVLPEELPDTAAKLRPLFARLATR